MTSQLWHIIAKQGRKSSKYRMHTPILCPVSGLHQMKHISYLPQKTIQSRYGMLEPKSNCTASSMLSSSLAHQRPNFVFLRIVNMLSVVAEMAILFTMILKLGKSRTLLKESISRRLSHAIGTHPKMEIIS